MDGCQVFFGGVRGRQDLGRFGLGGEQMPHACCPHEQPSATPHGGDEKSLPTPQVRVAQQTVHPSPEATGSRPSAM